MTQDEITTRGKRVKKWHAKTTTGCLTCRRRRIKCGEEKPVCSRCQRYGIRCDGYGLRNRNIVPVHSRTGVEPSYLAISTVPASVETTYGTFEQESSLEFYLRRTAPMLSMTCPVKDWWTVVVPQVSWHFIPIKHMIYAISFLNRSSENNAAQGGPATPVQLAKALNEYNRAITALRESDVSDMPSAIIFSFIAWTFDYIANNCRDAPLHKQAARKMLADSKTSGTRLSMQEQLIVERAERMLDQGNVACGRPYQMKPRAEGSFVDLQESWRELYYVVERAASNIDMLVANGWGPLGQSLDEWRATFEQYRYVGSASVRQKRAILLAQNMLATYLASMDPQSTLSWWERERDCILILGDLESIVSMWDNLDELRWVTNLILLNVIDVVGGSKGVMSRIRVLNRVMERSASRIRGVNCELDFIVSIEGTMAAKHAAFRQARALWIEHNDSTQP